MPWQKSQAPLLRHRSGACRLTASHGRPLAQCWRNVLWGRDPFAKGSPPPHPPPLKILGYLRCLQGLPKRNNCAFPEGSLISVSLNALAAAQTGSLQPSYATAAAQGIRGINTSPFEIVRTVTEMGGVLCCTLALGPLHCHDAFPGQWSQGSPNKGNQEVLCQFRSTPTWTPT